MSHYKPYPNTKGSEMGWKECRNIGRLHPDMDSYQLSKNVSFRMSSENQTCYLLAFRTGAKFAPRTDR
jgi:hypothetical protein